MARSSSSKNLETRFETLCAAHNELIERFNKLEQKQKTYAELYQIGSNTLTRLITKLYDYGYLDKPENVTRPLPEISSSGCKIIQFNSIKKSK